MRFSTSIFFTIWTCLSYSNIFRNLPGGDMIHTAPSQSPRGVILRWVMGLFRILFKGTVQRDYQHVFSSLESATGQWVKIFAILMKISPSFSGIILLWVNLPGVSSGGGGGWHSWPRVVNSHFWKLLHRTLKGQCHKNKYRFLYSKSG